MGVATGYGKLATRTANERENKATNIEYTRWFSWRNNLPVSSYLYRVQEHTWPPWQDWASTQKLQAERERHNAFMFLLTTRYSELWSKHMDQMCGFLLTNDVDDVFTEVFLTWKFTVDERCLWFLGNYSCSGIIYLEVRKKPLWWRIILHNVENHRATETLSHLDFSALHNCPIQFFSCSVSLSCALKSDKPKALHVQIIHVHLYFVEKKTSITAFLCCSPLTPVHWR